MEPRTQLDSFLRILKGREDAAVRIHAAAIRDVAFAHRELEEHERRIESERPRGSSAGELLDHERTIQRMRGVSRELAQKVQKAQQAEVKARQAVQGAHQRLETIVKVASRIRAGILDARDRAELRELDDLAVMRFQRA
ncbi:MAG: flagellar FliJ family protein [Deltaproteobacteria bacterium]|nr:flagellar FliJ family protein [Deltaproteobacteria bacterium]